MKYGIREYIGDSCPSGQKYWYAEFENLEDAQVLAMRLWDKNKYVEDYHVLIEDAENWGDVYLIIHDQKIYIGEQIDEGLLYLDSLYG